MYPTIKELETRSKQIEQQLNTLFKEEKVLTTQICFLEQEKKVITELKILRQWDTEKIVQRTNTVFVTCTKLKGLKVMKQ